MGQEGRKARHWCSVDRLSLPAYLDTSFGDKLYIHINTCNIFAIAMHSSIAIKLQCACNGLVKLSKNDRSCFVTTTRAKKHKNGGVTQLMHRLSYIICISYWEPNSCFAFWRFSTNPKMEIVTRNTTACKGNTDNQHNQRLQRKSVFVHFWK